MAMVAIEMLKLSLLFTLLIALAPPSDAKNSAVAFPLFCNRIECPTYDVIDSGYGFEIHRYNSLVWVSSGPISDISLHEATRTGFLQTQTETQISSLAPITLGQVDEKLIYLNIQDGVKLLRASFNSPTVLTHLFLPRIYFSQYSGGGVKSGIKMVGV